MAHLFSTLQLRELVLANRIGVPSMCQYSAQDGMASDWHFVHYGSRAIGGPGLITVEATAVAANGRISAADLGLWDDAQIEPLARIVRFAKAQGCIIGVQLAHAGRKASVTLGWQPPRPLSASEGGWNVVGPSPLAFAEGYPQPHQLDAAAIAAVIGEFIAAARRARAAGFQTVQIHAAHGYLLHQFLSPLANQRTDSYGGSFENRTRLVREVLVALREVWPERYPLWLRISATDWAEGGWEIEQSIELARSVRELGVDLVDVSSGGLVSGVQIPVGPGYQLPQAAAIKAEIGTPVIAVGLITEPAHAEEILVEGKADAIGIARGILYDPRWPWHAAAALGAQVTVAPQYLRSEPHEARGLFKLVGQA